MFFTKLLLTAFMLWSNEVWANEEPVTENSSFIFSEEEGLKAISKEALQDEISDKTSSEVNIKETPQETSPNTDENTAENSEDKTISKKATTESISESFAPKTSFLDNLFQDTSWIFQKQKTKHKLALVPVYSYNKTEGAVLGLRLFSFAPEKKGYYLAFSSAKYVFKPYYYSILTYISDRSSVTRSEVHAVYDGHYENYYGSLQSYQEMQAPLNKVTKLHSHRFKINYDIFYQKKTDKHYLGSGVSFFSRIERAHLQDNKSYFPSEHFLFLRAFAGFDTRDNWKYPKKGSFHQVSFGCKANLVFSDAYCQAYGDFRLYVSLLKDLVQDPSLQKLSLSLRAFYGTSLFSEASYSVKYSLGGSSFFQNLKSLRGFKTNRFIGDKMYFAQSEIKLPLWKDYLIGALFLGLGETAQFKKRFTGFVYNYGGGFRIGWPNDTGMKLRVDYSIGEDRQKKRNYDFVISFLQAF